MRVLHIEMGRQLYGGARQVAYLLRELPALGVHNVLVCATGSEISKLPLPGVSVITVDYLGDPDIRLVGRLCSLYRYHNIDLVHVHSRRGADWWGPVSARLSRLSALVTRRVDNPESWLGQRKYPLYDAVVSISEGVQQVIAPYCQVGQLTPVIHSAIDPDEFRYSKDQDWLCRTYDIPPGSLVIASFAQLIERKGQATLIRAMRAVIVRYPQAVCLLFGKGKMYHEYQQLITQCGLTQHVKLCGFTREVARILPCVDMVAHPACAEGLGVILLQAAVCERPIVSCPVGGISEIIKHGQTGLLVPPQNPAKLSQAIIRLLDSPALAARLATGAANHVLRNFGVPAMARQYVQLYQRLLVNSNKG